MGKNSSKNTKRRLLLKRLSYIRAVLLQRYPLLGSLAMNLEIKLEKIGTAATDMKHIMVDPDFANRLSDNELGFIMMHEVLHCALKHCSRSKKYNKWLYNIASDIVVNSTIMSFVPATEFIIDGAPVMHLAPNGREGYCYSVEVVYDMLLEKYKDHLHDEKSLMKEIVKEYPAYGGDSLNADCHDVWENIPLDNTYLDGKWEKKLAKATKEKELNGTLTGFYNISDLKAIEICLEETKYKSNLDWKVELRNFLNVVCDNYDYVFSPYDRRFVENEFMLPSFGECEIEKIKNIWFVVDTSASIDNKMLNAVLQEIKSATKQIDRLEGKLSFFDTSISEPILIDGVLEIEKLKIKGGGGTDFRIIFEYLQEKMKENPPTGIVIMTDGLASFPPQEEALGIPVLWIIVDTEIKPPWGNLVTMKSDGFI